MRDENITDADDRDSSCSLCKEQRAPLLKLGRGCGCGTYILICGDCARHIAKMFDDAKAPVPVAN